MIAKSVPIGNSVLIHEDCFEWLKKAEENSVHAVITDPPYGLKEYESEELEKRANGKGGVWRIPPSFDGHVRSPLPRFTALNEKERKNLGVFFQAWSKALLLPLRPGAHVFIATNAFLAPIIYSSLIAGGLEFRGQIIRLVRTLRGGDRPKNSEHIFPEVSSMPRSCYEPWGLFRKPIPPKMTVGDCLKEFGTGGIRRLSLEKPFPDVIESERTSQRERKLANHPSLKPQTLLRQLTFASLPLGFGVILDPFMGSGSTIAAVESMAIPNVKGIGVEKNAQYFEMSIKAVPALRDIQILESPPEAQQGEKELKKEKQNLPLPGQLLLSSL